MAGRDHRKPIDPKKAAKDAQVADRVRRARMASPPRNDLHYEECADLAREAGEEPFRVMDFYDEVASTQEYLANVSRAEAERIAMVQVRERFTRQRSLA